MFLAKQIAPTAERKLACQLIHGDTPNREQALWFIQTHLKPNIALFTHGASIYNKVDQWWPVYGSKVIHKNLNFLKHQISLGQ